MRELRGKKMEKKKYHHDRTIKPTENQGKIGVFYFPMDAEWLR